MTDSEKLDLLISKVSTMEQGMGSMKQDIDVIKQKVASIEMTLENEVNTGIKIIGEGHADLNRRLDRAMKLEYEKETIQLRLLSLEIDVRNLKENIKAY